nr:hypothetical protein MHGILGOP_00002 [Citrobacter sp.]
MIFNTEVRLGFVAYGVRIEETDKVSSNNAVYIAFFLIKLNAFPAFSGRDGTVAKLAMRQPFVLLGSSQKTENKAR